MNSTKLTESIRSECDQNMHGVHNPEPWKELSILILLGFLLHYRLHSEYTRGIRTVNYKSPRGNTWRETCIKLNKVGRKEMVSMHRKRGERLNMMRFANIIYNPGITEESRIDLAHHPLNI